MIKSINGGSHIQISCGSASDPYIPNTATPVGMVRYVDNNLETYDGNTWHRLGQAHTMISLTESATKAINWAIKEMEFEAQLEKMGEEHPAVKAAHEHFRRAAEQLKATIILSQNE
jgi:hypothetical protein